MSTYLWTALTNNQVVAFDPSADVLRFDSTVILAVDVVVQSDATAGTTTFTYNGKTVTLQTDLYTLTTTNVAFDAPTDLIVGDNSVSTAGDNSGVVMTGGASLDQ